jgi:N-acetylglucosaminyldiphosphoundecaprenol N-acetyl-beta-D-mannosaminyltransferase
VENIKVSPERVNVLGVGISVLNLDTAEDLVFRAAAQPSSQRYVTVTGVHGVVESQHDDELKRIHNRSYLSTPDGMPMVWLGKWYGHAKMSRVYGPDLMLRILDSSISKGCTHYFFGGGNGVAQELQRKLVECYPRLAVCGTYTPPFRPLNEAEELKLFEDLVRLKPHFIWVGLSTPKQEKFMHDFLAKYPNLTADWDHGLLMFGVGAAFDFHAGKVRQAPKWIQRSGLEWLFRVCMDPKRLFKRYAYSNTIFISKLLPQMMGLKNYPMSK